MSLQTYHTLYNQTNMPRAAVRSTRQTQGYDPWSFAIIHSVDAFIQCELQVNLKKSSWSFELRSWRLRVLFKEPIVALVAVLCSELTTFWLWPEILIAKPSLLMIIAHHERTRREMCRMLIKVSKHECVNCQYSSLCSDFQYVIKTACTGEGSFASLTHLPGNIFGRRKETGGPGRHGQVNSSSGSNRRPWSSERNEEWGRRRRRRRCYQPAAIPCNENIS